MSLCGLNQRVTVSYKIKNIFFQLQVFSLNTSGLVIKTQLQCCRKSNFLFLPVLHSPNEYFKDLLFWKSIIASRGLKRIIWM